MLAEKLVQTWDLERIIPGGCGSPEFKEFLANLDAELAAVTEQAVALTSDSAPEMWASVVLGMQEASRKVFQAYSYTGCATAQDTKDTEAKLAYAKCAQVGAALGNISVRIEAASKEATQEHWEAILAQPSLQAITWNLNEIREKAVDKMPASQEVLAVDLAVDGYHGWGALYDQIVGRIVIPVEIDGKVEELSVGQATNKFHEPDRALRQRTWESWKAAWGKESELIGHTLNSLSGFRLGLYKHRGWDSILKEPLSINRMSEASLEAMFHAAKLARGTMTKFLERKAQLLGLEKLAWYDRDAPLFESTRKVSYDEAATFIVEQFNRFSPRMANFAARAFNNRWIEVEDRPNKMPGGFMTPFPLAQESRIFMTFSGDAGGNGTLAHELGHAYHTEVMWDLPPMAQEYAMNVAETASTFAELIVSSAAIEHAATREEKLALLSNRLEDATAYLMNIPARFYFEKAFYAERAKGPVSVERISALMEATLNDWYNGALSEVEPLFWASKGHFYGTSVPFYNFPYCFGYLFSNGIYQQARQEGPSFESKYVDLLRDTGRMTVEELAKRHLGVDLTQPEFWIAGTQMALSDAELFLSLTEK
ncbi:MAG TPA: M3 family oligoendopeptidase [Symbiobacteriaceae bacterium]|nr:M3 family oligoendopeptidase [Symbiobacteriaceae bacterium]